jgi:riboflavin-specific deaminase-like protein
VRRLASPSLDLDSLYDGLTLPDGTDRPAGQPPRPWVALGMVSSVDGGATASGRTSELGGDADRVAFRRLRAACDAILVGAGTVRAETYGPPVGTSARQEDRAARGLAPSPRIVVVSGSLALEPDHRVFSDPDHRPLVVTHHQAPANRAAALDEVADVARFGASEVDLGAALDHLGGLGHRRILCEGGPRLNASLATANLVDEVFLTVTPVLLSGSAPRILVGDPEVRLPFELVDLHEHDGELLLRYRRAR